MTDKVFVQDTPLGVLVIVLALFCLYIAWAWTNYTSFINFFLILLFAWLARIILGMGITFIKGLHIDIS